MKAFKQRLIGHLKIVLITSLSLSLIASIFVGIFQTDFFNIQKIDIDTENSDLKTRLLEKTNQKLIGLSIFSLDLSEIVADLKLDPWVEDVSISRRIPNELRVSVQDKKPLAVVKAGDETFLLDNKSEIIVKTKIADLGKWPIMVGKIFLDNKDIRSEAAEILKSLPEKGQLSSNDVSDIQYNRESGFQIRLSNKGCTIGFGKENFVSRLDRVRQILTYLDKNQIDASHIDADFEKKVVVKVRKGR